MLNRGRKLEQIIAAYQARQQPADGFGAVTVGGSLPGHRCESATATEPLVTAEPYAASTGWSLLFVADEAADARLGITAGVTDIRHSSRRNDDLVK